MDFKAGLYDADGAGITSSTDLKIKIKRDTDDYFYDFDDSTFKNAAWTTIAATMTEIDATNVPGEYEYTVDVSGWDDGVYTVYYQYSGSAITPFTDAVEFRLYDGKESLEAADAILADTNELQGNQGNWATATGFSTPTNITAAQTAIIAEVDANETKIDSILTDTNELQGLISDSKLPVQVKGMDSNVITAAVISTDAIDADALKADAATEIATAVMAKVVDGTIDVTECMKIVLAVLGGDMAKSSNTYTYDDQSGTVKLTQVVTADTVTRTIA